MGVGGLRGGKRAAVDKPHDFVDDFVRNRLIVENDPFLTDKVGNANRRPGHGGPAAGQVYAFGELLLWYFINDMIIPGSMYWNLAEAGAKGAKDADKDLEGIEIMKYTAANLLKVATALQNSKAEDAAVARDKLFFTQPQEK